MSMSRNGTPADNSPIDTFYLDDIYHTTNACVVNIVENTFTIITIFGLKQN